MTDESQNGSVDSKTAFKTEVLKKLGAAGDKGLAASHLVVRRPEDLRKLQSAALEELVAAGSVITQHLAKTARYWLPDQAAKHQTPEEKADEMLRRGLPEERPGVLHTPSTLKSQFLKGTNISDAALRTCVRLLEQEELLVTFTAAGKTYYAYAPTLRAQLGIGTAKPAEETPQSKTPEGSTAAPAPTAPVAAVTNQQVIDAYRAARAQRRLPDIEIARLREQFDCSLEGLKAAVRRLCELGVLIPGKGDWSFASAAERAAAVMIHNEPHLFVRMKE